MKRSFPANLIVFITNVIIGFVLLILGIRVLLRLFGANPSAPFVQWIYETSEPLLSPFAGIFPSPVISNGFVVEFSSLFALIVYSLLAYLVYQLVDFLTYAADRRMGYGEGRVFGTRYEEEEEVEEKPAKRRGRRRKR